MMAEARKRAREVTARLSLELTRNADERRKIEEMEGWGALTLLALDNRPQFEGTRQFIKEGSATAWEDGRLLSRLYQRTGDSASAKHKPQTLLAEEGREKRGRRSSRSELQKKIDIAPTGTSKEMRGWKLF